MTPLQTSRADRPWRLTRRLVLGGFLSLSAWIGSAAATPTALAAAPLEPVYLYASPVTAAFFSANGASYDALKGRWRTYLRTFYGKSYREVSRAHLLAGIPPGVLVLGSAVLLDDQERKAIAAFAAAGGSVLATWGTGARDGKGQWAGYGFIENLLQMKVTDPVTGPDERYLNTFGDHPLTWAVPAGQRIFLGDIAEKPLHVESPHLAARYFDWQRMATPKNTNGAIAFLEKDTSRRVYFGFSEASWDADTNLALPKMLDSVMAWLRHQPMIFKAAWPDAHLSAQLLEMDTEDKFPNAVNFANELDAASLRGTFYLLTGAALAHRELVHKLSDKHEIGYHAELHAGFKGKTPASQQTRLNTMVSEMKDLVGFRALPGVSGFRAPTESWDDTTEKLLRKLGVRHHVADPAATEARLPVFSSAEPGLGTEEALVVLPRTQMDDLSYLGRRLDPQKASELSMLDFDYVHEAGALGVLSVHSQNYASDGLMAKLIPPYIKRLQQHRDKIFVASGSDMEAWWRARERVVHDAFTGSASRLSFEVRAPGHVKGVTFIVTHPAPDQAPKSVKAINPQAPLPELKRLDAYRSALVFKQVLQAGLYDYSLAF